MPESVASRLSVKGRRPTATTSLSTSIDWLPALSSYSTLTLSEPALADVTFAPRRISSPCFLNARPASFATSRSAINKKSSIASRIVTLAPRRAQTLPNSRPITPAPTTPSRSGTASNSSAPHESTIRSPSKGAIGISIGVEPLARTILFADMTSTSPSTGVNSTFLPASNLP